MSDNVCVVTDSELGWDCVLDVIVGDEAYAKKRLAKELDMSIDEIERLSYAFTEMTISE